MLGFRGTTLSPVFFLLGCTFDASGLGGLSGGDGGFAVPGDGDPPGPDAQSTAPRDATSTDADAAPVPAGLAPIGMPSVVGDLGGDLGESFAADCPEGRVVTGFDAEDNDFGLCRMRAICSRITLAADGSVTLIERERTDPYGDEDSFYDIDPVECPQGSIVIGFVGSYSSAEIVHHIRLICAPIQWLGDRYVLGPGALVQENLGSPHFAGFGEGACSGGEVAGGFQGRSGSLLDKFQLRCFELGPVSTSPGGDAGEQED